MNFDLNKMIQKIVTHSSIINIKTLNSQIVKIVY